MTDITEWFDELKPLIDGATPDGSDCHTAPEEYGGGYAVEVESGLLLYSLVRRFRPVTVVETGTHRGYASAWIALGLSHNFLSYPKKGIGHLFTIDSDQRPEMMEHRRDLWWRLAVGSLATSCVGDSREPPATFLRAIQKSGPIDFLYLDADHSAENVNLEFGVFSPLLNTDKCLIAFHDSRLDPREAVGIRQIIQAEVLRGRYEHIKHLPFRNMRGIDLLLLTNEDI